MKFSRNTALLLLVADELGFLRDHKVNYELGAVPYGRKGLEELLEGKADIAALLEANIAYLGYLNHPVPIKAFASIQRRLDNKILLRHNRQEIVQPHDLSGKRIAFMPRTTSHMFLFRFLEHHKIGREEITLKTITPQAMPDALLRGEVDAISCWNPHIYYATNAMSDLGHQWSVFQNNEIYKSRVTLVATKPTLVKHRREIDNMLHALKQAQNFIAQNEDQAIDICAAKIRMSEEALRKDWYLYQNILESLDQAYFDNVQMLGEWIRENDTKYKDAALPDYHDFIDHDIFLANFDKNN